MDDLMNLVEKLTIKNFDLTEFEDKKEEFTNELIKFLRPESLQSLQLDQHGAIG